MNRKFKMKTVNKIAISVATVMGLGLAVAYAQPESMGNMGIGMNPGMMRGQMMEQNANMKIMRELMTPAERLAMMDKMMDAKTVEERQAVMTTTHTEMEKRAKEKGITLPAGHGPQMMSGRMCG
jgi:hypothetical protein